MPCLILKNCITVLWHACRDKFYCCIVRVIYPLWSLFYSCTHNTYLSQLWWIKVTISLKLASFACLWLIIVLHITNHRGLCIYIIFLSSAHMYLSLILRKMLHNIFSSLLCVKTVREHICCCAFLSIMVDYLHVISRIWNVLF